MNTIVIDMNNREKGNHLLFIKTLNSKISLDFLRGFAFSARRSGLR
jgi:hypothetical protein